MRTTGQILLVLLTAVAAWSQVDTGTITGTISDSQGARVGSATIIFLEVATGVTTRAQTQSSGEYASPPLRPGDYKVTAEAQGFKTESRAGLSLRVQDRLRIDFTMSLGAVSESVEVTSEAPVIQSETSSLGQVIMSRQIT
ncbi:MAG: hypothetical protein DMG63_03945, partial [Acidobacteria bacterium]